MMPRCLPRPCRGPLVAAVEAAGLDAVVVDLDAFAIQNQFELSSPGGDGTDAVALIDIGASVMKTNVIHAGACIFARDVPFGGNNYTDAIAQRLNVSTEMAEAAKQGREVGVNWDDLVPALEAVSRELSLEVQRTFERAVHLNIDAAEAAKLQPPEKAPPSFTPRRTGRLGKMLGRNWRKR